MCLLFPYHAELIDAFVDMNFLTYVIHCTFWLERKYIFANGFANGWPRSLMTLPPGWEHLVYSLNHDEQEFKRDLYNKTIWIFSPSTFEDGMKIFLEFLLLD